MLAPPISDFLFHRCTIERAANDPSGGPDVVYSAPDVNVKCQHSDFSEQLITESGNTVHITALIFFDSDTAPLPLKSKITVHGQVYFVERCSGVYADDPNNYHHLEVFCV